MTDKEFVLTEEHIKLLKRMNVGWSDCEFGAPEIDPKHPYGNSNVYDDIADIIGIEKLLDNNHFDGYEFYSEENRKKMDKFHAETETALQIVLQTGEFKCGRYVRENYVWCRKGN